MKRFELVIASEYLYRVGVPALGSVLGIVCLPYVVLCVFVGLPASAFEAYRFHLPYLGILFCLVGALIAQMHDGLRSWLFTKPLSNRTLLVWLMLVPMLVIPLAHVLANALIGQLYGAHWPYVRPALYFALLCAAVVVGYWLILLGRLRNLVLLGSITAWALIFGYRMYFVNGYSEPPNLDVAFSPLSAPLAIQYARHR